jgi:hypothetical protein
VDWNSDGQRDMVSGDRNGYFNLFIERVMGLDPYYKVLLVNGDTLRVGANSQPAVTDWDMDGKKDLLLGCEAGYVYLYLNQTTDEWPQFQNSSTISAGGSPIFLNRVNPYVVDFDQDGRRDLVCGANDGYVRFYRNTGSDTNPTLAAEEIVMSRGGSPIMPSGSAYGSRLGFCDWNNDGYLDFLISGYDGLVELWLGGALTGTQERMPAAVKPVLNVNPTIGRTFRFECSVPRSEPARLSIYDGSGRIVREFAVSGNSDVTWSADCPAGVYLSRLAVGNQVISRRLVVTE